MRCPASTSARSSRSAATGACIRSTAGTCASPRFTPHTPVTAVGLKKYLGSGVIKGVGPKTAERIVEHFGEQTLAVLELEPERLIEVRGIGRDLRARIVKGLAEQQDIRDVMLFLQGHGVSPSLAGKIYRQYGKQSITVIRENPYTLEKDVYGVGFKTADTLAEKLGTPRDSLGRLPPASNTCSRSRPPPMATATCRARSC